MPATTTGRQQRPEPPRLGYSALITCPHGEEVPVLSDAKVTFAARWVHWVGLSLGLLAVIFLGSIAWDVNHAREDQRQGIHAMSLLRHDVKKLIQQGE